MDNKVFKVLTDTQMAQLEATGEFYGSEHDKMDGFIHLVDPIKLETVISKYFYDQKIIHLLRFDARDFGEFLRWERGSYGHDYPHLYREPLYLREVIEKVKREL